MAISRRCFFKPDTENSSSVVYSLGGRRLEKERKDEGARREDPRGNDTRLHLLPWQSPKVTTRTRARVGLLPGTNE